MVSDIKKEISFEDVSFKYDGSEDYALKNFSIRIPAGNVVALVGYSGAGKSTTADLLARFYIPQNGCVRVDGNDLKDINKDSWRSILGIVSQEVILFNDTITANISYGDDNPDLTRIYDAAKAAYALDFIENMPDGFNTEVGDRGIRLSGGERQRIAIARAIYRNPRVLILDEATSSLDSHSERLVQNAIDNLVQGRTVLVIAHRLSTVQRSDSIIVIDKGKKICEGTHNELLNICPKYRELYEMQFDFGSNTS
jgi:ABC-type multidrug transport system fused ATPase/permease subunit